MTASARDATKISYPHEFWLLNYWMITIIKKMW